MWCWRGIRSPSRRTTSSSTASDSENWMLTPVRVADFVLDAIAARIGAVGPEQGGALVGLPGLDYVPGFIHDADAATTGTRYQNTDWLIAAIGAREAATAARFKGIVHSHPRGMPVPSGQDQA